MSPPTARTRLVFLGGGHAHLYPLSRARELARRGIEVTLIAPNPFWYSGMGPGLLSGLYEKGDDTVDLRRLVESRGGTFIEDTATSIDAEQNRLVTAGGASIEYDALSLNIGSEVPREIVAPADRDDPAVFTAKPVRHFLELREKIRSGQLAARDPARVLVIGGGAAGCESAANAAALFRSLGRKPDITLVTGSARLLDDWPRRASAMASKFFAEIGIRIRTGARVASLRDGRALLEDGAEIPFDAAVLAAGVRPPDLIRASPLRTSVDGALLVDENLQSVSHPGVFGGGDCIALEGVPLARVGVYAVRQGPVLFKNLIAHLEGSPLETFRPQSHYLLILNLGDGTGLLAWRGFVYRGRSALRFKEHLDRSFMRRYQRQACEETATDAVSRRS